MLAYSTAFSPPPHGNNILNVSAWDFDMFCRRWTVGDVVYVRFDWMNKLNKLSVQHCIKFTHVVRRSMAHDMFHKGDY